MEIENLELQGDPTVSLITLDLVFENHSSLPMNMVQLNGTFASNTEIMVTDVDGDQERFSIPFQLNANIHRNVVLAPGERHTLHCSLPTGPAAPVQAVPETGNEWVPFLPSAQLYHFEHSKCQEQDVEWGKISDLGEEVSYMAGQIAFTNDLYRAAPRGLFLPEYVQPPPPYVSLELPLQIDVSFGAISNWFEVSSTWQGECHATATYEN